MVLSTSIGQMMAVCLLAQAPAGSAPADCRDWRECRQEALDAAARHDYEQFHDLAWRTVQKGPSRDHELMYLLARAQSLSGRPHDALVMIGRLAEAGFMTTAATSPDFERVRSLAEWPSVRPQVLLAWVRVGTLPSLPARATGSRKPLRAPVAPVAPSAAVAPNAPAAPVAPDAPDAPGESGAPPRPLVPVEEALRLPPVSMTPAGLAHDSVSGRFVIADRERRKLVIVDERARHLVDLVGAESAGFNEITALVIDARRGDLWVVSGAEANGEKAATAVLHRVQLVSGRPLASWPLPPSFGAARFGDVAVGDSDTVFVLDVAGKRIFPVTPRTGRFGKPLVIPFDGVTSLTIVCDHDAYVAHGSGIARISLAGGSTVPLRAARGVELKGFERIRWDRGRLVGIQRMPDGSHKPVRLRLAVSGTRVTAADVIEAATPIDDPTTIAVSDDSFYFVTRESPGGVIVVHRARLQ
jgi:hypothetical protein